MSKLQFNPGYDTPMITLTDLMTDLQEINIQLQSAMIDIQEIIDTREVITDSDADSMLVCAATNIDDVIAGLDANYQVSHEVIEDADVALYKLKHPKQLFQQELKNIPRPVQRKRGETSLIANPF
jgi:hypothetical protein|tara:strand:+ start:72 stop:446 length:375 start_codon:yes stop_codon:yes gene_type:complete